MRQKLVDALLLTGRKLGMRNIMWLAIAVTFVALASVVAQGVDIVVEARQRTPQIIADLWNSQRLMLTLGDFRSGRLDLLLAVQDPLFYQHHGVNLVGRRARTTTVTQALVKYLYFDGWRPSAENKIRQTLIAAFALDPLATKDEQLTVFVNTVYLGSSQGSAVRGFAQGAEVYFGKRFEALTEDEYLSLVAMLDAPNALSIARNPEANAQRVSQIRSTLMRQ